MDLLINPAAYGTNLNDQTVTRWNDEVFADAYYQQSALQTFPTPSVLSAALGTINLGGANGLGSLLGNGSVTAARLQDTLVRNGTFSVLQPIAQYTFTFNGAPVLNDLTLNGNPVNTQNIDISLTQLAGFGFDDLGLINGLPGGLDGPNDRLLAWYVGTASTSIQQFDGNYIDRMLNDQGLRATLYGYGLVGLGNTSLYSAAGWYAVSPTAVVDGLPNPTIPSNGSGPIQSLIVPNLTSANPTLRTEGIGEGFFYGRNTIRPVP
jgi:hypothetical protein